jgi:hypothetical protein
MAWRKRFREQFIALRTTLNGNFFKHFPIMTNCRNSDTKVNATSNQALRNGGEFVTNASEDGHRIASSCCWPLKKLPKKDIMFTSMVNTIISLTHHGI